MYDKKFSAHQSLGVVGIEASEEAIFMSKQCLA